MIRTTIRLNDHLFRDIKQLAAKTHQTLTSLIEESLREKLRAARRAPRKTELPELPVFHGSGVQPGVDIDDSAALLDLMEQDVPLGETPMILLDINVLLYAFRDDLSPDHKKYKAYLRSLYHGNAAFGASSQVLSGFLRITTNPRAFKDPTSLPEALNFIEMLRKSPAFNLVEPGPRHWAIFLDLCRSARAKGNRVSDAYHAAVAIESDSEFATTDRDFTRFPGLKFHHPLEG